MDKAVEGIWRGRETLADGLNAKLAGTGMSVAVSRDRGPFILTVDIGVLTVQELYDLVHAMADLLYPQSGPFWYRKVRAAEAEIVRLAEGSIRERSPM